MMTNILLVALGGGLGAAARYLSGIAAMRLFGPGFPWGTIFVNIAGSFLMGLLVAWLAQRSSGDHGLRLFMATGFLGGFTTFSAFSLDFATLFERGDWMPAFTYVTASVLLSIVALFSGLWLMRG